MNGATTVPSTITSNPPKIIITLSKGSKKSLFLFFKKIINSLSISIFQIKIDS